MTNFKTKKPSKSKKGNSYESIAPEKETKLRNMFEQQIYDDPDFREQWAEEDGDYDEDSFEEWLEVYGEKKGDKNSFSEKDKEAVISYLREYLGRRTDIYDETIRKQIELIEKEGLDDYSVDGHTTSDLLKDLPYWTDEYRYKGGDYEETFNERERKYIKKLGGKLDTNKSIKERGYTEDND